MDVLVASTNVFRLELSAYVLAEAGFHVRECRNNTALLQEVAQLPPHVLLIDQHMLQVPHHDSVRSLAQQHNISLLWLVTGSAHTSLTSTADEYVTWPYQAADLLARVRALCSQVENPVV